MDYDFETGKPKEPGRNVDYFTQLVWDESTKLGMGVAFNGNKVYVVGRYIKRKFVILNSRPEFA